MILSLRCISMFFTAVNIIISQKHQTYLYIQPHHQTRTSILDDSVKLWICFFTANGNVFQMFAAFGICAWQLWLRLRKQYDYSYKLVKVWLGLVKYHSYS